MRENWKLSINFAIRVVLLGVELAAFIHTDLLVMLSGALDALVDMIVTGSLLFAHRAGARAGDSEHPFGHLRMRNIISLIVAVCFITVTSLQIIREAIPRLLNPAPVYNPEVAIYVLGFAFVLKLIPIVLIFLGGRKEITLKTTLYDNINDEIVVITSIIGAYVASRGAPIADPLVAIIVALFIGAGAVTLIRENTEMLLGRSPDKQFYQDVKEVVQRVNKVQGVHDMIAEYIGPGVIHLDLDLELDPNITVKEADQIVEEVAARLRDLGVVYCKVHPCAHTGEERLIRP